MRDSSFFQDTPKKVLDMAGQQIEIPACYYDLRYFTSIFTVKTSRLRNLLPHATFKPIEVFPGIGMLGITAFEYRDTSIGPYNEIAIAIPIVFPPKFVFPTLNSITMLLNNIFPVYIHHLPVTTEIALQLGIHFWNYPKFLAEITFQDQDGYVDITLKENDALILRIRTNRLNIKKSAAVTFHTYSIKGKTVMHGFVEGWAQNLGTRLMGKTSRLELGEHRISKELRSLEISSNAFCVQHAEGAMTKLYDPDQEWNVESLV